MFPSSWSIYFTMFECKAQLGNVCYSLLHFLWHCWSCMPTGTICCYQSWQCFFNPSCRVLILSGCYRVTNTGIKAVCDSLTQLRTLDISSCTLVTEVSLQHIAQLPRLECLLIANINIQPEETYSKLPKLFPNLKTLCLSDVEPHLKPLLPKTKVIYCNWVSSLL